MVTHVGIKGLGRIGRQSLRAILERHPDALAAVVINDITDTQTNAYLFRYDSTMVLSDHLVKVVPWYDNEWGYACRMADLTHFISEAIS